MSDNEAFALIRLEIENVKKVRSVRILPKREGVTKIAGANGQGKTSTLDSIEMLLSGKRRHDDLPIRQGATGARIVGEFETPDGKSSFVVTRRWTGKNDYLDVKRSDCKVARAQEWLDALTGNGFGFDPEAFLRLKDAEQVEEFFGACTFDEDPRALDAQRADVAAQKTVASKALTALDARLAALPEAAPEIPDAEVSVAALVEELERLNAQKEQHRQIRVTVAEVHEAAADAADDLVRNEAALATARAEVVRLEAAVFTARASSERAMALLADGEAQEQALVEPDTAAVTARMRDAETVNTAVRAKLARRTLAEEVLAKRQDVEKLAVAIRRNEERKAEIIGRATFPVPGLGFEVVGGKYVLTLDGVPLSQAADSDRIRVSMGIAFARNPELKLVLIRHGSLLDKASMTLVTEMAEAAHAQVIVEIVGAGDGDSFVIEDGFVVREPVTA